MPIEWQPRDNIAHARATDEKSGDTLRVSAGRVFISVGLLSLRLNLRLMEFVEINHVHPQTELRRGLRVAGHKLFTIVVQVEVEWISGIFINQDKVGIVHGELAKAEHSAPVRHEIAGTARVNRGITGAKHLGDLTILRRDAAELATNLWRRKDLLLIENNVVCVRGNAFNLPGIDQVSDLHPK